VVLSLEGRVKHTALEISVEDLKDDGMITLIKALDSVFAMTDYIIDFEWTTSFILK
jgi:hypothetical protein